MKERSTMPTWERYLTDHQQRFIDELTHFLSIPSVSSQSENMADVREAGLWLMRRLKQAGLENVELLETGQHPLVYADWLHAEDQPTVLIYGHFDVQPIDPIELWEHPPFEPVIKDDRIYARGATDDKGNLLIPIIAIEALLAETKQLPVNVKFCLEGQEEIGSPRLADALQKNKAKFACDLAISADGAQKSETEAQLFLGRRGMATLQVDVSGPNRDLHSGGYGGSLLNPIHALADIVAAMHDSDGRVQVPGFYDSVAKISAKERALLDQMPFDETTYSSDLEIPKTFGEKGFSTLERIGIRPTLEMNGIWGGYQGEGTKTIIPATAHAKISCRLVPNQDPDDIGNKIIDYIRQVAPPAVTVNAYSLDNGAYPYAMSPDYPGNQIAADVLEEIYGAPPYFVRGGGTIPACSLFLKILGCPTINFSFGLNDERLHSPNEFFRLASFCKGQKAYCYLFNALKNSAQALRKRP